MWENLRADTRRLREIKSRSAPWYVLESLLFENGYQAVVLHRVAHWLKRRRVPILPAAIHRWSLWLTAIDIAPAAQIGPGLLIGHGAGLVIGHRVRIGRNAHLVHGVTLGGSRDRDEMPTLGDDVFVATGACVLGAVHVGDGSFIGVHALVTEDVPPRSKVLSTAAVAVTPRQSAAGRPAVR
jgi:serine O-acetyltransferase